MTPQELKAIARAIDLHGTMSLTCGESRMYFRSSKHHVFYVQFTANDATRELLHTEFVFYDVGDGFILLAGENARILCKYIKPYTAWHKNQIKISEEYALTHSRHNTSYGTGANVNEYREQLVKKFNEWNRKTRAKRAAYNSKRKA